VAHTTTRITSEHFISKLANDEQGRINAIYNCAILIFAPLIKSLFVFLVVAECQVLIGEIVHIFQQAATDLVKCDKAVSCCRDSTSLIRFTVRTNQSEHTLACVTRRGAISRISG
jgi:hypothetical protein